MILNPGMAPHSPFPKLCSLPIPFSSLGQARQARSTPGLSSPSPIVSGRGDELVSRTVTAVRNQGLDGSHCHCGGHRLVSRETRSSKPKLPVPESQCEPPVRWGAGGRSGRRGGAPTAAPKGCAGWLALPVTYPAGHPRSPTQTTRGAT